MFQTPQPVRDKDYSNMLENHSTEMNFPQNDEDATPAITYQPQIASATRRAVPVLTTWQSSNVSPFIPMHGLDFLLAVEKLHIQQTVELNELLANEASENRYSVKVPEGETLYYASETSSSCERMWFGPNRSFVLKLYDQTHQEALQLRRRLACGTCSFWCYLQAVEVWVPPGDIIGTVEQQISFNKPFFLVCGENRDPVYRIEGPTTCACTSFGKDAHFKIYSADGMAQVGSINRQWDQIQLAYNLCIQFPSRSIDSKCKALLLSTAFLLEYLYFSKTSGCRCTC